MNVNTPLMQEHQVIKRMLHLFEVEIQNIEMRKIVDPISINICLDFIRTYADQVHQGKEENIFFREFAKKHPLPEHARVMYELMQEHAYLRTIAGKWLDADKRYFRGEDTSREIINCLKELTQFYPEHINKENRYFLSPVLDYFQQEEQDKMIREFREFDEQVLQWKYRKAEEALQERLAET